MTNRLRGILCIASLAAVVALESGVPPADSAAIPPPTTAVTGDTPPPLDATATPKPEGTLLRYTGQILDERKGYVFFTTGDAYRLAPDVKIDDAKSGGVTALLPETRTFARATFDGATGQVIELGLSPKRLPDEATYDQVKGFAVALSTPYANPDLRPVGGFNGKPVLVVFTVEVPPDTPFSDTVYLATDASGWSATAIKMDRIDALHYRVARNLASGTKLLFRYTLGSWQSAERGQDGLEVTPRVLTVHNSDVQTEKDIVYHWGGSNQFDPGNDQSIPTPFNPIPFNTPPHR